MYRLLACLFFVPAGAAALELSQQQSPETGLLSWTAVDQGFDLTLIQVLADYVRATYEARGLPPKLIDTLNGYCVFGTIVRNRSDAPLRYDVSDWRYVTPDGESHPIKTKRQWVEEWHDLGVAFSWSILPEAQTLERGDWQQGFTTVKLPPDSPFDLVYSWSQHGEEHVGTIPDVRCAPKEPPER